MGNFGEGIKNFGERIFRKRRGEQAENFPNALSSLVEGVGNPHIALEEYNSLFAKFYSITPEDLERILKSPENDLNENERKIREIYRKSLESLDKVGKDAENLQRINEELDRTLESQGLSGLWKRWGGSLKKLFLPFTFLLSQSPALAQDVDRLIEEANRLVGPHPLAPYALIIFLISGAISALFFYRFFRTQRPSPPDLLPQTSSTVQEIQRNITRPKTGSMRQITRESGNLMMRVLMEYRELLDRLRDSKSFKKESFTKTKSEIIKQLESLINPQNTQAINESIQRVIDAINNATTNNLQAVSRIIEEELRMYGEALTTQINWQGADYREALREYRSNRQVSLISAIIAALISLFSLIGHGVLGEHRYPQAHYEEASRVVSQQKEFIEGVQSRDLTSMELDLVRDLINDPHFRQAIREIIELEIIAARQNEYLQVRIENVEKTTDLTNALTDRILAIIRNRSEQIKLDTLLRRAGNIANLIKYEIYVKSQMDIYYAIKRDLERMGIPSEQSEVIAQKIIKDLELQIGKIAEEVYGMIASTHGEK